MVDTRTGIEYEGAGNCPSGYAYLPDSQLLICNCGTLEEPSLAEFSWYEPVAYYWNEEKKVFDEIEGERK